MAGKAMTGLSMSATTSISASKSTARRAAPSPTDRSTSMALRASGRTQSDASHASTASRQTSNSTPKNASGDGARILIRSSPNSKKYWSRAFLKSGFFLLWRNGLGKIRHEPGDEKLRHNQAERHCHERDNCRHSLRDRAGEQAGRFLCAERHQGDQSARRAKQGHAGDQRYHGSE